MQKLQQQSVWRLSMKVSVCVPVYNGYDLLSRCVNAVRNWTFCDYELIIIDDRSTDKRIKEFGEKNADIFIQHKDNLGNVTARYNGTIAATGDYIAQLDIDTIVTPHWAEKLVTTFGIDSRIGIVGPIASNIVGLLISNQAKMDSDGLIDIISIAFNCLMFPASFIDEGIMPNTDLYNSQTDYDFCQQALQKNKRVVINPKVMVYHHGWVTPGGEWIEMFNESTRTQAIAKYPEKHQRAKKIIKDLYDGKEA